MTDDVVSSLLRQAGVSFVGTVQSIGAATMPDIPVNSRTAVVHVDKVLDAPSSLSHLADQDVTVLLESDAAPTQQFAFFTNIAVLGKSLAVTEVGRLPTAHVQPHVAQAAVATAAAAQPLARIRRQMEASDLQEHAGFASVILVGRIIRLEQAGEERYSEHAPHYWRATLQVQHVEKGDVSGTEVTFIYPASQDVRWVDAPKPQPRQQGMWMLHPTTGELSSLAAYELEHADDYRPAHHLENLRQGQQSP